jgi:hypothetical protein
VNHADAARPAGNLATVTEGADRALGWAGQLRATHARLRDALDLARDALEQGGQVQTSLRDLQVHCLGFCAALSGHHRAEDTGLFPAIERAHPELVDVLRYLRSDHSQLEHLLGSLTAAVRRGEPPEALLRHLDGVEAIMESHFGYEERRLLAVLERLHLDAPAQEVLGPLA